MNTHTCIKPGCGMTYEDTDTDAYYCPPCVVEKNRVAAEIDRKLKSTVSKREHKGVFVEKDFIGNGRIMFDSNGVRI